LSTRAQDRRGATEVLLAVPGSDELIGEVADLVFHALVLVARDGRDPLDVFGELARRHEA
jgi:phosphoribosyl-ATP pyrophosphohydrolase